MDDGLRLAFFMYIGTSALFAVMIGALNRAKLQRYLVCWSLYWLLLAVSYVGLYLMLRIAVEPFIGLYTVALVASVLMLHAGGRDILALTHNQRRWFVVYGLVIGTTAVLWFLPVDMAMHIVFVSWCLSFFYALTGWMFVRLQGRIQRAFSVALFFLALSVLLYGVFAGNPTVQTTLFAMNGFSGILIGLSMINLHYQQLALRDAQQTAKLLGMSYLDSLTALHNRNYYETMLNTYDHEALLPLSIIMIDLNHLKIVNDTYGHHIGDHMIKQVADWLK
ncbi:MAG: diguanylate cyclase, partial [Acholeplasmatales bacterium]